MNPLLRKVDKELRAAFQAHRAKEARSLERLIAKEYQNLKAEGKLSPRADSWIAPLIDTDADQRPRLKKSEISGFVEGLIERYFDQFRRKTLGKINSVLERRPGGRIQLKKLSLTKNGPVGTIEVDYPNEEGFEVRSGMVWVTEGDHKSPHCRFPGTFHRVRFKGEVFAKKSHAWMLFVFTGLMEEDDYRDKIKTGELNELPRGKMAERANELKLVGGLGRDSIIFEPVTPTRGELAIKAQAEPGVRLRFDVDEKSSQASKERTQRSNDRITLKVNTEKEN